MTQTNLRYNASMSGVNPYASPLESELLESPKPQIPASQHAALVILVTTIATSIAFTFVDQFWMKSKLGVWPILIVSCFIAQFSAYFTREVLLPTLTTILATLACCTVVGLTINWSYAQPVQCLGVSIVMSFPALIVALFRRKIIRFQTK